MPLLINLRQLEKQDIILQGELPVKELEISGLDECIEASLPLKYNLEAQLLDESILVRGQVSLDLQCTCVRCLKVFTRRLDLRDWAAHIARVGDEQAPVVNDMVDLTPLVREDILLEFPQYPLCETGCQGLSETLKDAPRQAGGARSESVVSSAWAELNKLKL
jgi:uncharacterized protein